MLSSNWDSSGKAVLTYLWCEGDCRFLIEFSTTEINLLQKNALSLLNRLYFWGKYLRRFSCHQGWWSGFTSSLASDFPWNDKSWQLRLLKIFENYRSLASFQTEWGKKKKTKKNQPKTFHRLCHCWKQSKELHWIKNYQAVVYILIIVSEIFPSDSQQQLQVISVPRSDMPLAFTTRSTQIRACEPQNHVHLLCAKRIKYLHSIENHFTIF